MQTRSSRPDPARERDAAVCRRLIRHGSKTFHAASLFLPARLRDPAYALYAFCRLSDDTVDGEGVHLESMDRLRARLARVYEGCPEDAPVDRAFADVVETFDMPQALPEALLDGLDWDLREQTYETLSDLYGYAARVAGGVGVMMAVLMGTREAAMLARACDLGVAMQLTNIARDVGEDARAGRLYLPRAWMREAGLDPEAFLAQPDFSPALGTVVARLLHDADRLYARSESGIAGLPPGCRPAIFAARHLYAEIGRQVERNGHDSVSTRAVVSARRKATLLAKALAAAHTPRSLDMSPPLPETAFLVRAAERAFDRTDLACGEDTVPWWRMGEQIGRAAELLAGVEQRRLRSPRPGA